MCEKHISLKPQKLSVAFKQVLFLMSITKVDVRLISCSVMLSMRRHVARVACRNRYADRSVLAGGRHYRRPAATWTIANAVSLVKTSWFWNQLQS